MPDFLAKDRTNADIALPYNANGRAAAASSKPVVLATEDKADLAGIRAAMEDTNPSAVTPTTLGQTSRGFTIASGVLAAFAAASSAEATVPALGATREVRLVATQRCWIRWGATGIGAAAAAATSFLLPADSPEVVQLPAGVTHFRVIRDTTDGNLLITPVA